jgi:hypothetical protein
VHAQRAQTLAVKSGERRSNTKRIVTPLSAVALGVLLWFVVYALARREVAKVRVEGADPHPSPKPIVIYAIASGLALFASIALMTFN